MQLVRLTRNYSIGKITYGGGQIVEVEDWLAEEAVKHGDAVRVKAPKDSPVAKTDAGDEPVVPKRRGRPPKWKT